jgi:hypothetical protein
MKKCKEYCSFGINKHIIFGINKHIIFEKNQYGKQT